MAVEEFLVGVPKRVANFLVESVIKVDDEEEEESTEALSDFSINSLILAENSAISLLEKDKLEEGRGSIFLTGFYRRMKKSI